MKVYKIRDNGYNSRCVIVSDIGDISVKKYNNSCCMCHEGSPVIGDGCCYIEMRFSHSTYVSTHGFKKIRKIKEYIPIGNGVKICKLITRDEHDGNLLINIDEQTFIHIGIVIEQFTLDRGDKLIKYSSPISNSDVPYPVLITEKYTYLIWDSVRIENEHGNVLMEKYKQKTIGDVRLEIKCNYVCKGRSRSVNTRRDLARFSEYKRVILFLRND